MAEQLLKYGLLNDELVSIEAVSSGLGCGCVCPSCGSRLMAKKGSHREHHFAHYQASDCHSGCESALHLMAKRILEEKKELFIPDLDGKALGSIKQFNCANLESRAYSGFVPDVILKNDEETLCVEILVTHAIDEEKSKKIFDAKLPTVEIDLHSLLDDYNEENVTEALMTGIFTVWIYNAVIAERRQKHKIIDELCDLLPLTGYGDGWCKCPLSGKSVSMMTGQHSCHECWYYNHRYSFDQNNFDQRPCNYREKVLLELNNIADCRRIVRLEGKILSIEILVDDEWQHWEGNSDELLSRRVQIEKKNRRCCFTGHRPEKLSVSEEDVKNWLEKEIRQAIADGFVTFLSGMARGVDIWAAEIVLRLKEEGQPIHLICCIPYDNFESRWPPSWWMRYAEITEKADIVHFTGHEYFRGCEQVRNKFMVDHCARVLAVYNGTPGGTKNTIDYATRCGRQVVLFQAKKN